MPLVWWDLRNGTDTNGWFDSTLYGWRTFGDLGMVNGLNTRLPTFYAAKLMQCFAQPGDTILKGASDYLLLSAYADPPRQWRGFPAGPEQRHGHQFQRADQLDRVRAGRTATVLSYGIPQDEAARTNAPAAAQDIATNTFTGAGSSFSYSFPALSLTLFTLAPSAPQPGDPAAATAARRCVRPSTPGPAGRSYYIQVSTNLAAWTTVSTNRLTSNALNFTNPVPAGAAMSFWRAVWQP